MKRIFGIISIVVGLVFMAVAALFLLMAFIQPGNAMAVPIGISAIGGVISSVCIMLGIRLIKSSGSQTNSIPPDAHGSFLPNVEEERTTE
ncbi:MAG: hypothetical protein ACK47R_07065, partial [Planctomycetia bacterium]